MEGSAARKKATWLALMLAALVVGLALFLVVLSGPGLRPQPAQAAPTQTTVAPKAVLTIDGQNIASFSNLVEAKESVETVDEVQQDGTTIPNPKFTNQIVLERTATADLQMDGWYQTVSQGQLGSAGKSGFITYFDGSGTPTLKFAFENAYPTEVRIAPQGNRMVETVRLTGAFERKSP